MLLALQSVLCLILVILVGTGLSQSADVLAEKTGLGRSWVGTVLLAGATSLPELATGMSAVVVFNAPDLAAGGIFGSCLFNLLLLALLDVFSGPEPLLKRVQIGHALAAGLGSVLLGMAATGMLLARKGNNFTGRVVNITNDKIVEQPVYNYTQDFPYLWEEISVPISYTTDRDSLRDSFASRAEQILLECAACHTENLNQMSQEALRVMRVSEAPP